LQFALKTYNGTKFFDVRAEVARTKYKLSHVLKDTGTVTETSWKALKTEAQTLRTELTSKQPDEEDNESSYDELVAYFYR